MATKKSTAATSRDVRAFTVVVEQLRGDFRVFGEALQGMRQEMDTRFAQVDRRLDGIDRRLDGIDVRLDGIDVRLDGIDVRLEGIDVRLDSMTRDVGLVKIAVLENSRELKGKVERAEVVEIVRGELRKPR